MVGPLLVSWEGIENHGSGVCVALEIGNPTTTTLGGVRIHGTWSGDPGGSFDTTEPNTLLPGYCNKVRFQIPGTKEDRVSLITVGIDVHRVNLQQR